MRICTTARYERDAKRLLKSEEQAAMEQAIATNPGASPVMEHMAGLRKSRWARQGAGKSGGLRVIYYYMVVPSEVHFVFLYAKKDQPDLTAEQRKMLKKYVVAL